jgi:hypothetical protein
MGGFMLLPGPVQALDRAARKTSPHTNRIQAFDAHGSVAIAFTAQSSDDDEDDDDTEDAEAEKSEIVKLTPFPQPEELEKLNIEEKLKLLAERIKLLHSFVRAKEEEKRQKEEAEGSK